MKNQVLLATAASFCCGLSLSAIAQDRFSHGSSTSSTRLVGIQVDSDESPLDYAFSSQEDQPDPQSLTSGQDPTSNPVDSILENANREQPAKALVSTTANSSGQPVDGSHIAPLYWSQTSYSHNALADYMRHQWCSDGLWDTYPAERAAQCAKQWELISGARRHGCGHCGQCGQAGVHAYSGHCGRCTQTSVSCDSCGNAGESCGCAKTREMRPINRYRLNRQSGCGTCNPADCGSGENGNSCSTCDSVSQSDSTNLKDSHSSSNSLPASVPVPESVIPDKVAFLPLLGNR